MITADEVLNQIQNIEREMEWHTDKSIDYRLQLEALQIALKNLREGL